MKTNQFRCPRKAFTLLEILIAVAILGILVGLAVPAFKKSRDHARKQMCIENLAQIESAKQQWGLDKGKGDDDVPETADLIGATAYIRDMPACAAGGEYKFNHIGGVATCTISGHTL